MNNLFKAWNWLQGNWSKIVWTLLLVLILVTYRQCESNKKLKNEIKIAQDIADLNLDNYIAILKDSIEFEKNQNGQLIQKIRSIVLQKEDFEKRNLDILDRYQDALNINKELSKINSVISAELRIKDSIINTRSFIAYDKDFIKLNFDEVKKWDDKNIRTFIGVIELGVINDTLKILNSRFDINQAISLKAAIVEENGYNSLKIMSGSPDVLFTQIENISIINQKLNEKPETKHELVEMKRNMFGLGINNKIYFDDFGRVEPSAIILYNYRLKNAPIFFNVSANWSLLNPQKMPQTGIGVLWSPSWMNF